MDFTPREIDAERAAALRARGLLGRPDASGACSPTDCAKRPRSRSPFAPIAARTAGRSATSTRSRGGSRPACAPGACSPATRSRSSCPNWLEAAATFYAIAYLGAVVVPIVHFYGPKEVVVHPRPHAREGVGHRRPVRRARLPREPRHDARPICPISNGSRWSATTVGPGNIAVRRRLLARRLARRVGAGRPERARAGRVHVGHDERSEGCRARAPHDRRRDPSARRHPARRGARGSRPARRSPPSITGAPVGHGIGMIAALLMPVHGRRPIHLIDVWDPGPRAAGDARRGLLGRPGLDVLPHEPARPSRLRSRAPRRAHAGDRPRRVRRCRPRSASARSGSASRRRAASAAPSIRRSRVARRCRRATSGCNTDGEPLPGVEMRLVDDDGHDVAAGRAGRDLEPRARLLRRLHRSRR